MRVPDHQTTRPPDYQTTRLQDHQTKRPKDHQTTRPLKLLRLPNLLIIVLTQAVVYYYILRGSLVEYGLATSLSHGSFWQLTGATVLVSAAGYIINDLYDRTADRVNLPFPPPVEAFGVGRARMLYGLLVVLGTILSIDLARRLDEWEWLWLYPAATVLLAAYSPFIKPRPLWGNLLVAAYCAGVPGLIWLGERNSLALLRESAPATARLIDYTLVLFMTFAFTITLLREVVKDLEDRVGDERAGRRTLPVVWGENRTRWVAFVIGLALAIFLPFSLWLGVSEPAVLLVGVVFTLVAVLLILLNRLGRARDRQDYGALSSYLKWYMLGGLFFLLLFRWYQ